MGCTTSTDKDESKKKQKALDAKHDDEGKEVACKKEAEKAVAIESQLFQESTCNVGVKCRYVFKDTSVDTNIEHFLIGPNGSISLSGIDENGGFFEMNGKFQLNGEFFVKKALVGIDDEEITFNGSILEDKANGSVEYNKKVKGGFFIQFLGKLWKSQDGFVFLERDKSRMWGLGKDEYGFALWEGSINSEDTIEMKIFYANGIDGKFIGKIQETTLIGIIENSKNGFFKINLRN